MRFFKKVEIVQNEWKILGRSKSIHGVLLRSLKRTLNFFDEPVQNAEAAVIWRQRKGGGRISNRV